MGSRRPDAVDERIGEFWIWIAVVLVAVFFYGVVEMLERSPPSVRPYFARIVEVWIAVLLVAGFGVFANNLVVIVFGVSLL